MNKTLLWMTGAICSFTLMAVGGRELSASISTAEILFFRSLLCLVTITLIIIITNQMACFKTANIKGQFLRNIFHFLAQYGWFVGLGVLPLAQVFAIEFTVPFWTAIIASIFLKERLSIAKVTAIIVAFTGVLLIVKPPLDSIDITSLIVLGAAVLFACAHSCTKMLSRHDNPLTILFYMCLIQFPLATCLMPANWTMPSSELWPWILIVAFAALSAHFCMTKAMLSSAVTTVVTLDFMRLPMAAIVAWFLYQEPFGILSIFGTLLILIAILINFRVPASKANK